MPTKHCVDFENMLEGTEPGRQFTRNGFTFKQMGEWPMRVHQTDGEKGLWFPGGKGIRVRLPAPTRRAKLRLGTFSGPAVEVQALGGPNGSTIIARRKTKLYAKVGYENLILSAPRSFTSIALKQGNNEDALVKLCIS